MPVFVQRRLGKAYTEPTVLAGDFRIRVRKLIVPSPYIWYNKTVKKQSNSMMEVPLMVISYNKLWKLLIDRKMSKADLRRAAGIAPNTMTKLNRDEEVTLETLGKICAILNVNIGDIVDFLPTNQTTEVNLETK